VSKKNLKVLLKLCISIALLYFVYQKINFNDLKTTYQTANPLYLLVAIVFFVTSQLVSSVRLNYIFHQSNFMLSQKSNLKLYFVGMFYNFFIPGGIGGDAYKVYLLNKRFDWKLKTITQNVLVDRLIGLIAIAFIACLLASHLFFDEPWFLLLGIVVAALTYIAARWMLKLFIADLDKIYWKSFVYSISIQLLQIVSVYFILLSIGIKANSLEYFLVFLISSVLSVVSFSGFGAREFVFLQASMYLATDAATATSIGLTFNIMTAIVSLFGALFLLKKVQLKLVTE
jgi:uncharacterized membrane protein YbhN (UPF0104 family)